MSVIQMHNRIVSFLWHLYSCFSLDIGI